VRDYEGHSYFFERKWHIPRYRLIANLRFEIGKTKHLPFPRHGVVISAAGSRSAG